MLLLNRLTSLLIALLLAFAAGCGSGTLDNNKVTPDGLVNGSVTRDELLSDLDALKPAGDVDAQDFASIKGALKAALIDSSTTKFTVHPPQGPNSAVTDLTVAYLQDGRPGIQWTYVNPGDYNFDGQTNLRDLTNLGAFLGAVSGDERWDQAQYVDGDGNGAITIADITPIAVNFLGTITAFQIEGADDAEGPFEQVTQVPVSDGKAPGELQPYEFNFGIVTDGASSFDWYRISPLDPAGNEGSKSNLLSRLILNDNVHHVSSNDPSLRLVSRDGFALTILDLGGIGLQPGDVLISDEDGGFILKVEEIVSAGESYAVQCMPANLADAIKRGAIHESRLSDDEMPANVVGAFEISQLAAEPDFTISVTGGDYNLSQLSGSIVASYGASGLTYGHAAFYANHVEYSLDLHVSGSGHFGHFPVGEDPVWTNYERVVDARSFLQSIPLAEGFNLPMRVTCTTYLGVEGGGTLDGEHDLHFRASFGEFTRGARYVAETGAWETITYLEDPVLNASASASFSGTDSFTIEPYLRIETKIEMFHTPTSDPAPGDVQFDIVAKVDQNNQRVEFPVPGFDYTQIGSFSTEFSTRLGELGITLELPVQQTDNTSEPYARFAADGPPPVTFTLSGSAYDGSSPLAGAQITVRDSSTSEVLGSAVTDGAGLYTMNGLPDGANVLVTAALEGYEFSPASVELTMDSDKVGVDFFGSPAVGQTYGVSGYLLDFEMGTPIVGALVYLYDGGGVTQLGQTETDSAGHYSFSGLSPFSTVRVAPSASGYGFVPSFAEFTVTGEMGQNFTGYLGGSGP